jgi:hypothetical protein
LITKQNKVKSETEKTLKNIQEAQKAEPAPAIRQADYQSDLQAEFKKMISGSSNVKGLDKGGAAVKAKEFKASYCGCGDSNP